MRWTGCTATSGGCTSKRARQKEKQLIQTEAVWRAGSKKQFAPGHNSVRRHSLQSPGDGRTIATAASEEPKDAADRAPVEKTELELKQAAVDCEPGRCLPKTVGKVAALLSLAVTSRVAAESLQLLRAACIFVSTKIVARMLLRQLLLKIGIAEGKSADEVDSDIVSVKKHFSDSLIVHFVLSGWLRIRATSTTRSQKVRPESIHDGSRAFCRQQFTFLAF